MAVSQEYMNETIAPIATVAATAAVCAILVEREDCNKDELPDAEVLTQT